MSPAQFVWHTATASITQCSRCKNTSHRHGKLHWMCSRDAQAGKWCVSWWACHWCHSLDSSCTRQRARSAIFMVRESLFPIRYNGRGQSWASWWPSGQRFINAQFAISIDSSSICNNRIRPSSALDNVFVGVTRLGSRLHYWLVVHFKVGCRGEGGCWGKGGCRGKGCSPGKGRGCRSCKPWGQSGCIEGCCRKCCGWCEGSNPLQYYTSCVFCMYLISVGWLTL